MSRLERGFDCALKITTLSLLGLVLILQVGIHHGRRLEARGRQELPRVLRLDVSCESLDGGEFIYLRNPSRILDSIRMAEGAPSYGILYLGRAYGGHQVAPEGVGRRAAARLLHGYYIDWVGLGRPGTFLRYMADRYAPIGARSDPMNLNAYWHKNVVAALLKD